MATRKAPTSAVSLPALGGIDLAEFRRQKQVLEQEAAKKVAEGVGKIREILKELQELSNLTDVSIDLSDVIDEAQDINSGQDWMSSSAHC